MLLNSIAAIGKYAPSKPTGGMFTNITGRAYQTGANGGIYFYSGAPSDTGRDTISAYLLTLYDINNNVISSSSITGSDITTFLTFPGVQFTNLDVSKYYYATVAAQNSAGTSQLTVSTSYTPQVAPQGGNPPGISSYTTSSVTLTWNAWSSTSSSPYTLTASTPSNGNLSITGYKVDIYDVTLGDTLGTWNFSSSSTTGATLSYGTTFPKGHRLQFNVYATNAMGTGYPSSYTSPITPNP